MKCRLLRGAVAAFLMMLGVASAQEVRLVEAATARAEASPAATSVGTWRAGKSVELIELRSGWARVRDGATLGWLRASNIDTGPAVYASAAARETGRRASGNEVVSLGVRGFPAPRLSRHALIIGVGSYRVDPARRVENLPGVARDMSNALIVARYLQVPIENTVLLRDEAASREGVAAAIAGLQARMNAGDRAFIYWAGHGSRFFDPTEGACVESLVTSDLKDVSNREFASWIKPIGEKSDKLFVMFDACHSAGVGATRSLGTLRVRSAGTTDACQVPSNVRTRSLAAAVRATGLSAGEVVHVASARADEASFEDSASGGLATSALRECLAGDAVDADGSGAITMTEIAACIQAKVEMRLAPYPYLTPSHLTLYGNASFVPALFAAAEPASPVPPTASAPTPVTGIADVVREVYAQRDGKWKVEAMASPAAVKIGAQMAPWSVTSERDGYLYVVMVGSDRKSLYLLFPNDIDRDNRIKAGQPTSIPRPAWGLKAAGPAGSDEIMLLVAEGPRDLGALSGMKSVSFSMPLTDAAGRAQLQRVFGTNSRANGASCQAPSGCSDAFGAAMLTIEEHE